MPRATYDHHGVALACASSGPDSGLALAPWQGCAAHGCGSDGLAIGSAVRLKLARLPPVSGSIGTRAQDKKTKSSIVASDAVSASAYLLHRSERIVFHRTGPCCIIDALNVGC